MKIGSLEVGRLGLGAWQAGGGAWRVDFSELKKAYEHALDNGINFIDTAEVYGNGRSEEFVGGLIRGRPHVVVATKVAGFHWGRILKAQRGAGGELAESTFSSSTGRRRSTCPYVR